MTVDLKYHPMTDDGFIRYTYPMLMESVRLGIPWGNHPAGTMALLSRTALSTSLRVSGPLSDPHGQPVEGIVLLHNEAYYQVTEKEIHSILRRALMTFISSGVREVDAEIFMREAYVVEHGPTA